MTREHRSTKNLPLEAEENLKRLGSFLRWARQARRIPVREMASRLMVSPATVVRMEKGDSGVSVGTIFRAVYILGLSHRFEQIMDPAFDAAGLREVRRALEGKRIRGSSKSTEWGEMDF